MLYFQIMERNNYSTLVRQQHLLSLIVNSTCVLGPGILWNSKSSSGERIVVSVTGVQSAAADCPLRRLIVSESSRSRA